MPGTVEHVVAGGGRALVGPPEEAVELAPGAYCSYPGDLPHILQALETGTRAVLISEHV